MDRRFELQGERGVSPRRDLVSRGMAGGRDEFLDLLQNKFA